MGRRTDNHNPVLYPRDNNIALHAEQARRMWEEVQRLKAEIRPGMMFVVPSVYYSDGLNRQEDHIDNKPVKMYVTETYPDIVTLIRHVQHCDITISPSYARLLLFERQYGSGRRPKWE